MGFQKDMKYDELSNVVPAPKTQLIVHISLQLWVQWPHTGSMKQVLVGVFMPQKLTNAANQGLPFTLKSVPKHLPA